MLGFELTEEFREMLENEVPIMAWRTSLDDTGETHEYSERNRKLLAMAEAPDGEYATHKQWLAKNRIIKKGEHGYRILANIGSKKKEKKVTDDNGEEKTIEETTPIFKNVVIFHIDQTEVWNNETKE